MEDNYKQLYLDLLDKEIGHWEGMANRLKKMTTGNLSHEKSGAIGVSQNYAFLLNRTKERIDNSQ